MVVCAHNHGLSDLLQKFRNCGELRNLERVASFDAQPNFAKLAPVDSPNDPNNSTFEDESSRLKDSLKSCRALVSNYRAMMSDIGNDNAEDDAGQESRA